VFGTVAATATEQPTMPVTLPAKKAVKRPRFKARFYKTEPILQHKPKLLEADASSLWPDKKVDVNKNLSIQPKFVANLGAAAEKSLMAINYFEYFARVQKKAHSILTNKESSPEEIAAALDIISRITKCMGRCVEDVAVQQAYILTATTVSLRDAVLKAVDLPKEASNWMTAQPILSGTAMFGPVAATLKPILKDSLVTRAQEKYLSVSSKPQASSRQHSKPADSSSKKQQYNQQKKHAPQHIQSSSSNRGRDNNNNNNNRARDKPNFTRDQTYQKSGGGGGARGRGKGKPFHQGGAKGK
jgi:hypothetical protein